MCNTTHVHRKMEEMGNISVGRTQYLRKMYIYRIGGATSNNFGWAESAAHGPRSAKYDAIDYVIFDTRQ